jgi:hypothetical protein
MPTVDEQSAIKYLRERGFICLTAEEAHELRITLLDIRDSAEQQGGRVVRLLRLTPGEPEGTDD